MKKNIKYVLCVIMILGIYTLFLFFAQVLHKTGNAPVINAPSSVLQVSVKDKDKVLLNGVTASDDEDGNLTSEVFIESISNFDDQMRRTVTYAVFDSDDNLSRTTRQIQYTDYKAPEINIKKALCYYYVTSSEQYKDYVSAKSVVDGNISSQISVEREFYDGDNHYVTYSVTDSCGMKTSLTLKTTEQNREPNIDITLKKYLLRVKKGTTINPYEYIKNVNVMGIKNDSLKSLIEIQNDYNPNEEGMYEFIYRISRSNGDYGITKLVVIVE